MGTTMNTFVENLRDDIDKSIRLLTPFRQKRVEFQRQWVGGNYGDKSIDYQNPINLLDLAMSVFLPSLVPRRPRILVSTPHIALRPSAASFEARMNRYFEEVQMERVMETCVTEAFFGIGCAFTALSDAAPVSVAGQNMKVAQAWTEAILFEELFFDMAARNFAEATFVGHDFLVTKEEFHDSGLFDTSQPIHLVDRGRVNTDGTERSHSLSTGGQTFHGNYKDFYRLRNIWLPMEGENGLIVTVDAEGSGGILREMPWDGCKTGPYSFLMFRPIPGNLMPLPPVAQMMPIHNLANNIMRKIQASVEAAKDVPVYPSGSAEDAKRLYSANHLEIMMCDTPNAFDVKRIGGVPSDLQAHLIWLRDLFSWMSGNLEVVGGLSPQSSTVGQEELLAGNASRKIGDMQSCVTAFATDLARKAGYWLFDDPVSTFDMSKNIMGTNMTVPTQWTPYMQKGGWEQYEISIDIFSQRPETPQSKMANMTAVFQTFMMPMMEMAAQQGLTYDLRNFFRDVGRFADMPEIHAWITSLQAPMGPDTSMRKPALTTRKYIRENRPAPTRVNRDNAMMQTLLGGGVQPKEQEAALR